MKIRMLTIEAGPSGIHRTDKVRDVSRPRAIELIVAGSAKAVGWEPKAAELAAAKKDRQADIEKATAKNRSERAVAQHPGAEK